MDPTIITMAAAAAVSFVLTVVIGRLLTPCGPVH